MKRNLEKLKDLGINIDELIQEIKEEINDNPPKKSLNHSVITENKNNIVSSGSCGASTNHFYTGRCG